MTPCLQRQLDVLTHRLMGSGSNTYTIGNTITFLSQLHPLTPSHKYRTLRSEDHDATWSLWSRVDPQEMDVPGVVPNSAYQSVYTQHYSLPYICSYHSNHLLKRLLCEVNCAVCMDASIWIYFKLSFIKECLCPYKKKSTTENENSIPPKNRRQSVACLNKRYPALPIGDQNVMLTSCVINQ